MQTRFGIRFGIPLGNPWNSNEESILMKRQRPSWTWAVTLAVLAFLQQSSPGARAQDAQAASDTQTSQTAQSQTAEDQGQNTDQQDPPTRVARLNYVDGSVSFQPGGENDWATAVLNRPLVTGDNLWADENSRAELHIGSTALRLGPKTGITLLEVSDQAAQIRLAQGSLIVMVRRVDDQNSYEIDTPNVAFVVMQPGEYRIDVDEDGNRTDVMVRRGRGEITGGGNTYTVTANQSATITSAGNDQLKYNSGQVPSPDALDSWALDRDQTEDGSDSANYVSRDMTGYEDLDQNGTWSDVAGYGMVWQPTGIAMGWAPYRFGSWTWVAPWGWTWVENEPWGFAPFHYGRWALAGNGWVWVPGPSMVRPAYAPALVGWVGGGPGFHFSAGVGVGWFALAPGEVFIPGYRVSRSYVNNVNVTNTAVNTVRVTNVYNAMAVNRDASTVTYANRNVIGGVTVVSRETFVNGGSVARNVMPIPSRELATAPVSNTLAVEPVRSSAFGGGKPVAIKPPAAVISRQVVALRTPAPMPRSSGQSSSAQSASAQSAVGQTLVRQQPPGRPVPVAQRPRSQGGVHSFGEADAESNPTKSQPRVWEAQGTGEPEPESKTSAQGPRNRNQPSSAARTSPQGTMPSLHPAAARVTPARGTTETQKSASTPAQKQQTPHPAAPKLESGTAPKKGH
jgi:hypothetical protein